jgi:hypothetical protein
VRAVWSPLQLGIQAATLDRPLEFRFDDASLQLFSAFARYEPSAHIRVELEAGRYSEDRKRPDAAAFSWDQTRVSARVVFAFASGADLRGLPPAIRRMPTGAQQ